MKDKTIRVSNEAHSKFFSLQRKLRCQSSDVLLKILLVYYLHDEKPPWDKVLKGMYQLEQDNESERLRHAEQQYNEKEGIETT